MSEYDFKLEKVLKVRLIKEEIAYNRLIKERNKRKKINRKLKDKNDQQKQLYEYLRKEDIFSPGEAILAHQYLHNNRKTIETIKEELQQKRKKEEQYRQELIEKKKKREVLEKLKEKKLEEFHKEYIYNEQKEIDEIAGSYYSGGLA